MTVQHRLLTGALPLAQWYINGIHRFGIEKSFWDNTSHNVSWPLSITGLALDIIIAALPTVALCMFAGE